MTLDELDLRARFEARRALGTRALLEWALVELPTAPRSRTRAECVRGALVVALGARDQDVIEILAATWSEGPRVDPRPLLAACEDSEDPAAARIVARAVVELEPTAEALLVLAGVTERAGHPELAAATYRHAIERAERVADVERAQRGRLELARTLFLRDRAAEALDVLASLDEGAPSRPHRAFTDGLDARDTLLVAEIWLSASGRYRRASALELLTSLVTSRGSTEARAALRLVCAHIDRVGPALTEPEADRARVLVERAKTGGHPRDVLDALAERIELVRLDEVGREATLVRVATRGPLGRGLVERARAVRDHGAPGPRPESDELLPSWLALSILASLRGRRFGEALTALRELDRRRGPPEAAGWTALSRAAREPALRDVAAATLARWLADPSAPSPSRGHLELAARLDRAGLPDLAAAAITRARERHEPDARALSIQHAIRRAWTAYDRGDRREARWLLTTAMHDARAGSGGKTP